jgi:hypothetical protein
MRLRRIWRWWPVAVLVVIALVVYAAWPGRWTFTVSPETTHVTGPVGADGFIDYPTALNERLSKGVTPETNANVLIVRALGPKPEGMAMLPDYYRWLGVPEPPAEGDYFLAANNYFDKFLKDRPAEEPEARKVDPDDEPEFSEPVDPRTRWDERTAQAFWWPWKAADEPDLAAWIRANEKPLALIAEATRRPAYYNPIVNSDPSARTPRILDARLQTVQKCRSVGQALCCRAMGKAGAGDYDGAWADLMTCHRLGRLVSHGGTLIENLVGIAVTMIGVKAQLTLLSQPGHPPARLRAWRDDLRRLPPVRGIADNLDLNERFMFLDAMTSIICGGSNALTAIGKGTATPTDPTWDRLFTRSVDFDPAFRNTNQFFDRCVVAARLPDRAGRQPAYAALIREIKAMKYEVDAAGPLEKTVLGKSGRGELIGKTLLALLTPAFDKIQDAVDRLEQTEANLQVAFALALYRTDTGRYPQALADLAPKYLPAIPADRFSGGGLIYDPYPEGYLLYSVGANGQDDGGQSSDDVPKGDDVRVRMPVSEPEAKR